VGALDSARTALIDDNATLVRALTLMLGWIAPNAECRTASDGFSRDALVGSFRPQLIVLDVVMPGVSGRQVGEHIRSNPTLADIAVVIISVKLTDDLRARWAAAGADRFSQKPFSGGDLGAARANSANSEPDPTRAGAGRR
jgi:DNA-binding response OmpR family regulator